MSGTYPKGKDAKQLAHGDLIPIDDDEQLLALADQIKPDPLSASLATLVGWIRDDYGDPLIGSLIADLMRMTRAVPDLTLEEVVANVALDWSK